MRLKQKSQFKNQNQNQIHLLNLTQSPSTSYHPHQPMTTQQSTIKHTSQRYRQQIRNEFKLLAKTKPMDKLISLIEQFELDSKCQTIDEQLMHYLIVGYVVESQWLALKHLVKRYQLNQLYNGLLELAIAGVNEELTELNTVIFPKVALKIKERGKNFIQVANLDSILQNAKIKYSLKTLAKYYINLDLPTVIKKIGCNEKQIKEVGYEIKDNYVELRSKQLPVNSKATQEVLLNKMKNLVRVADEMTAFQ